MLTSPYTDTPMPARFAGMQQRLRAKLIGFLRPPEQVIQMFAGNESGVDARYALAVAYHRNAQLDRSLGYIDSLIKEFPRDPYFHELRGQILFESGQVRAAVAAYGKAVNLAPGEPLIRVGLAQAQIETGDPALRREALANLRDAIRRDDAYPLAWRLLAVAYGKLGDMGNAALANAEYAYLIHDLPTLRASLDSAQRSLKAGTPAWQRMQDLRSQVAQILHDRNR
jgi:predicted Zn-dependent protease